MIVLDTGHLTELERRGSSKGWKVLERLQAQHDPHAATVLVHGVTLLSANLRDFRQVPELTVEDWMS